MGIACIFVILCHAVPYGVKLGSFTMLFSHLAFGVDLFLLLSGYGIYFSLIDNINGSILSWYKKRIKRIVIPYIITISPFLLIYLYLYDKGIGDFVNCITFVSYFKYHFGLWFLPLIMLLYLVSPIYMKLFSLIKRKDNIIITSIFFILILCFVGSYSLTISSDKEFSLLYNTLILFGRASSFFVGWLIAYFTKYDIKWNIWTLVMFIFLLHAFFYVILPKGFSWWWLYTTPASLVLCLIIRIISKWSNVISFLKHIGGISLESYITNWGLILIAPALFEKFGGVFSNSYIQYLFIIIIGILLADLFNKMSNIFK